MAELLISPEAEEDLIDIWFYIAQDSPVNADNYIDKLEQAGQKLADSPGMGVERGELAPQLKSFPVDRYILFYRVINTGVELVRVVRGARDLPAQFDTL